MDAHDVLRDYLAANGLKSTRQREAIFEIFRSLPGHVSVEDLYQRVREKHPEIGYATVYRTLKLLKKCGLAEEHHFADGYARYESFNVGESEHHDHLICVQCGHITEFENDEIERLQEQVAASLGFTVTEHKMELYGVCREFKETGACRFNPNSRASHPARR